MLSIFFKGSNKMNHLEVITFTLSLKGNQQPNQVERVMSFPSTLPILLSLKLHQFKFSEKKKKLKETFKNHYVNGLEALAQGVQCLLCKSEALSSNPGPKNKILMPGGWGCSSRGRAFA
jgi:hypothetical protein